MNGRTCLRALVILGVGSAVVMAGRGFGGVEGKVYVKGDTGFTRLVPNAEVALYQISPTGSTLELVGRLMTDNQGYFKFTRVPSGSYVIKAKRSKVGSATQRARIEPGRMSVEMIELR